MKEFYTSVVQHGNNILVRGYDTEGVSFQRKVPYEPYLFISSNKNTGYKDIRGNHAEKKTFDSISDAKKFAEQYSGVTGISLYGMDRWPYVFIHDEYSDIDPDYDLINVVSIDIEVASDDGFPDPRDAKKEVTAIAIRDKKKRIVIGCGEFTHNEPDLYYIKCKNEYELLSKFLDVWQNMNPDVLTGWNSRRFDVPYLVNRIAYVIDQKAVKRLSPWGIVREKMERGMNDQETQTYTLTGISQLDYFLVYRKFQLEPRESYRLDYVGEVEVGQKKLDYSEYGNLNNLYRENYQKFIEYNIRDNDLIFMLEERLGYIEQCFAIAYQAKTNFEDALTSVLIWDVISHNHLMSKNIVVDWKEEPGYADSIEGGHVKAPIVGTHDWVVSFDLNSLYPHLIQQYNISPDTRVEYDHDGIVNVDLLLDQKIDTEFLIDNDLTMTPNGQFYRRDKTGFFAELMQKMYDDRTYYKKKMIECKIEYEKTPSRELEISITRYNNLQMAKKIQLNSAYGSFANRWFRWYDLRNAEAITKSGQLSIRWIEKSINQYLNKVLKTDKDYIIAVDTDSVYITFDDLVKRVFPADTEKEKIIDYLDKVCSTKFQEVIDKSYTDLARYVNAKAQKMIMKRENIADKGIWIAKKKYILNVWDSEGVRYNEPKLKMMGVEAIRSSTPTACRDYIKKTIALIMNQSESSVQSYVRTVRSEFRSLPFEMIAFPRSVNFMTNAKSVDGSSNLVSWYDPKNLYKKGTPIQVKAAFLYNKFLKENGLDKTYEEIKDGEKIKFCYLKKPNPIHDDVFACPSVLPDEFGIDKYVDRDKQFQKGFLDPIQSILDVLGWNAEKVATLDSFF